jgi:hypothetical protein
VLDRLSRQSDTPVSSDGELSSDNIVSNSIIRNKGSICGSQIIKRDLLYTLKSNSTSYELSWDFLDIVKELPVGFKSSLINFKVNGTGGVLANSKTYSGGINISNNNFPIQINATVRVSSPCGDIDLLAEFPLNTNNTGTFRHTMSVRDLNPKSGQISLTEQLNNLESLVYELSLKVNELSRV